MRTLDFPDRPDLEAKELEAALDGELAGAAADHWRELRADVRSLTPAVDPEFRARLGERLAEAESEPKALPSEPAARHAGSSRAWWRGRGLPGDPRLLGGVVAAALVIALGIVVVGPFSDGRTHSLEVTPDANDVPSVLTPRGTTESAPAESAPASPTGGPARIQELGATISLATASAKVQSVAGRVSRLAASEGGFVQRSQVEASGSAGGEATLELSIPSTRLTQTLAALGRLAPVRTESQSLQDITTAYESARRRLADTVAERAALLRALARADTQGQIESIRRRLSLLGGAITRARSALRTLSRHASDSSVEVTVLADPNAAAEGSTLHRGLHDAGHVLSVALIVLLVGLAALVPALAVLAAAVFATRLVRRAMRERALS